MSLLTSGLPLPADSTFKYLVYDRSGRETRIAGRIPFGPCEGVVLQKIPRANLRQIKCVATKQSLAGRFQMTSDATIGLRTRNVIRYSCATFSLSLTMLSTSAAVRRPARKSERYGSSSMACALVISKSTPR
jgi:hypothetical protein